MQFFFFLTHIVLLLAFQNTDRQQYHCNFFFFTNIYLVKYPESLTNLLLAVSVLHFPGHHGQKLWEVDGSISYK